MKKRKDKEACDWCCGGSILDCGSGVFRDFDSDLSYGVPVCGGCGGLGRIVKNEDFEARTQRIMDLRFEYCPVDSCPDLPIVIQVKKLEALINEVTELFGIYGKETDECFAKALAGGLLKRELERLRIIKDKAIELFKKSEPRQVKNPEMFREAFVAAHSGDIDKADEIFKRVIAEDSLSSIIAHDYAVYIAQFHRNLKDALSWFKKSIQLEPKKAIHFYNTIKCMKSMRLSEAVNEILLEALELSRAEKNEKLIKDLKEIKTAIDMEASQNN
ncbi:MAG: hypothetical protein Q8N59_00635 [bacterium]|nr:hypothetical protein [bacterium]